MLMVGRLAASEVLTPASVRSVLRSAETDDPALYFGGKSFERVEGNLQRTNKYVFFYVCEDAVWMSEKAYFAVQSALRETPFSSERELYTAQARRLANLLGADTLKSAVRDDGPAFVRLISGGAHQLVHDERSREIAMKIARKPDRLVKALAGDSLWTFKEDKEGGWELQGVAIANGNSICAWRITKKGDDAMTLSWTYE